MTRPPDLGRSRLDLPLSARVSETLRARLEGLPKAVRDIAWKAQVRLRPLSPPQHRRQEGAGGRGRDRTRNGSLPVGHWAGGRAVAVEAALPVRCTAHGGGATAGNSSAIPPDDPPLDRGQPRDEDTEGGTQPGDESLINRRHCALPPGSCAAPVYLPAPQTRAEQMNNHAFSLDREHERLDAAVVLHVSRAALDFVDARRRATVRIWRDRDRVQKFNRRRYAEV